MNAKQMINEAVNSFIEKNTVESWKKQPNFIKMIADRSGYSVSSIRGWMSGHRVPNADNLIAILNVCGYELEMCEMVLSKP